MSLTSFRLSTFFGMLLIFTGLVLQAVGVQFYAAMYTLGLMVLLLLILKRTGALVSSINRINRVLYVTEKEAASSRALTSWYGRQLLDYGSSIFKRTNRLIDASEVDPNGFVSQQVDEAARGHKGKAEGGQAKSLWRSGRVSTPNVENPKTNETMADMLDPERALIVGGIFGASLLDNLHAKGMYWRPGVVNSLLEKQRPDAIVLDQGCLDQGQWYGALKASGTGLMREILDGVDWSQKLGIPVFVIPHNAVPNVNSFALRQRNTVVLPMNQEDYEQSFGAVPSQLLARLENLAKEQVR